MSIGVPKEVTPLEKRVAQTPDTVSKLIKLGITVNVEMGAGEASKCSDERYQAAGANIVKREEVRITLLWFGYFGSRRSLVVTPQHHDLRLYLSHIMHRKIVLPPKRGG